MKRICIENEFTQWAEYLARYFGHDLLIYSVDGTLMWGSPAPVHVSPASFHNHPLMTPVYKDIDKPIAYLGYAALTKSETEILHTIIPFIESQLEDEGA
jgi:hypothetical protein